MKKVFVGRYTMNLGSVEVYACWLAAQSLRELRKEIG